MSGFKQYRRKQIAELCPWTSDYDMDGVSISAEDVKAGSPKDGDMIARNPKNHADKWLVAATYFVDNFEPIVTCQTCNGRGRTIVMLEEDFGIDARCGDCDGKGNVK